MMDEQLRALLVCPQCRGDLVDEADALRCDADGLRFSVVDGIPNMIIEEAERLGPSE